MSTSITTIERKELNKAQNIGIAGLIGAIIPVIGLLLGVISLIISSSVKSSSPKIKAKKQSAEIIASIAIILSLLSGVGYYAVYHQRQVDSQEKAAQIEKAANDAAYAKTAHDNAVQTSLRNCLDQANKDYRDAWSQESKALGMSNNMLPQNNATRQDNLYKGAKDNCYSLETTGDTSHPYGVFNFTSSQ